MRRLASPTSKGIAEFLRGDDKLSALRPTANRLSEIQGECARVLPQLFASCVVAHFEAGTLTIAVPSAAVASKLKQQLPKLQEFLLKKGWQVIAIRLKVQVGKLVKKEPERKQIELPARAISALAALHQSLEDAPQNQALKQALATMLERHGKGK